MNRRCANGCAEAARHDDPEWPCDKDQRLCRGCYIDALETKRDEIAGELKEIDAKLDELRGKS